MFKTFKAKIHGIVPVSHSNEDIVDTTITFSKYRILLKEEQVNRLFLDPMLVRVIYDREEYDFDKKLNRADEKKFSIIMKYRLNELDKGLYHLDINIWNKIKANIIHRRYWIDREKEWFTKTLLAAFIGFLFSFIGLYLGYRQGYQAGIKAGQAIRQDTTLKR